MQNTTCFSGLLCLALVGCSIDQLFDYDQRPAIEGDQTSYSNFGNFWVGHQIAELINVRGPPNRVLEVKPRWATAGRASFQDSVHLDSYIYYDKTKPGSSCVETFVVAENTGTIIKYYCF